MRSYLGLNGAVLILLKTIAYKFKEKKYSLSSFFLGKLPGNYHVTSITLRFILIIIVIAFFLLTSTYWKPIPTMKLAVQLDKPARAMAEGLGPCENSSATMNQGMGPGPISKKATKAKMATMLKYDIHLSWSYKSKEQENRLLKISFNTTCALSQAFLC